MFSLVSKKNNHQIFNISSLTLKILFSIICNYFIFEYFFILFNKKFNMLFSKNNNNCENSKRIFSKKWIVIKADKPPNYSIEKIINQSNDWKIVAIGDKHTDNERWNSLQHSCVLKYLSLEAQSKLGYKFINYIPLNSYSRKNIGYLYAIQHGAEEIYEIEDDYEISDFNHLKFNWFGNETIAYVSNNSSAMLNPYSYFGESDIWPRGFRIKDVENNINDQLYVTRSFLLNVKPLIFQGLINGYPDIDPFISLFNQNIRNQININFHNNYPLLYLPEHFVPVNSRNTKFSYEVFPALVLPPSINEKICDIVRGYIIQRFAWIYNGAVLFIGSSIYNQRGQYRNFSLNFKEGKLLNYEFDDLLSALTSEIKEFKNPLDFLIEIIQILVNQNILSKNDFYIYKSFIKDLIKYGYKVNINFTNIIESKSSKFMNFYSQIKFYVPIEKNLRFNNKYIFSSINKKLNSSKFKKILLMINYNNEFLLENNLFIKELYRKYFNNIIFISPQEKNNTFEAILNISDTIIYCPESYVGFYSYVCITKVFNKFPNMDGYLFTMDDVLMKVWEFDNFDINVPWITDYGYSCSIGWYWWEPNYPKLVKLYDEHPNWKINLTRFLGKNIFPCSLGDFYYIPKNLIQRFCFLAKEFYNYKIFLELAVPSIFGILLQQKYQLISLLALWDEEREKIIDYIKKEHQVICFHPVKLSNSLYRTAIKDYFNFHNLNANCEILNIL